MMDPAQTDSRTDLEQLAAYLAASQAEQQTPQTAGQAGAAEDVGQGSSQGAEAPTASGAQEVPEASKATEADDDLTRDPRFRRWQSVYDKRIAELTKQIQVLQSQLAQSGSAPSVSRDELARQYAELEAQYRQAVEAQRTEEAVELGLRLHRVADRIFEHDLQARAQQYGLNPAEVRPLVEKARDNGEVYDPNTLDAFLVRLAFDRTQRTFSQREQELLKREEALKAKEAELENAIRRAVAEQLQALGLTDMTGLQPGARRTPDLSQARSVYEALTILSQGGTNA